jgi:agmatinase
MTKNRITALQKSSFVKIQKEGKVYRIIHNVSGKQFVVDKKAIDVINLFEKPTTLEECNFDQLVENSIIYLVNNGVLVPTTNKKAALNRRQLVAQKLFGVKEYKPNQKDKNVVFLGVPFGGGNPVSRDTYKFPDYLRAFLDRKLKFSRTRKINPKILGCDVSMKKLDALIQNNALSDAGNVYVHGFETRRDIYQKISAIANEILERGHIPFTIGGDHSISYPLIRSVALNHESFNVIHFDAHTDVYSSSFDEILELNGLHHHGNFVSHCVQLPQLKKYYQFGIRGFSNAFTENIPDKVKSYWTQDVKAIIAGEKSIRLPKNEKYYLTFDIDVLDPLIAPGTGTPEPNGLWFDDIINLFKKLNLNNKNIIGIDFVEVNPTRDNNNVTTLIATQIILNLLNCIKL